MRQIEIIKGISNNHAELETLVNNFLAQTGGRVINVTNAVETTPSGVRNEMLIYTIEYENVVESWANLFNHVTFQQYNRENLLKAFFKLDAPFINDKTLNELLQYYKERSITESLSQHANITYKVDEKE
ncbi:hypothetical protein [Staphylococcus hominis]|uniref:hypothetical protein n=1 Tax=Staphylococcus hominis TaxID=1290 RepID=UPI000D1F4561|nr:hypothetical protein [Staphylococcus hominis]PTK37702.1 hypothetical protein BUZ45_03105 [Staphylococcus hominis]